MVPLISITQEPRGDDYIAVINFAAGIRSLFSLVWRDQFDFDDGAYEIYQRLQGDLVVETSTDNWPGTRLIGHKAKVGLYKMSESAIEVLKQTDGLYRWRMPRFPEDLAFYLAADRPWLGSIAHEEDSFIYSDIVDVGTLTKAVPRLRLEHTCS